VKGDKTPGNITQRKSIAAYIESQNGEGSEVTPFMGFVGFNGVSRTNREGRESLPAGKGFEVEGHASPREKLRTFECNRCRCTENCT